MSRNPSLFITVGTSEMVVPEAFHLPGIEFGAVHILTTGVGGKVTPGKIEAVIDYFGKHHPQVELSVIRVDGFDDLKEESDHRLFEEVLYRWMISFGGRVTERYVCLSGGYKSMSATVQKAAGLFGAAEVFHVLATGDSLPSTFEEVGDALELGEIQWIRMGAEPGWPQLVSLPSARFPLNLRPLTSGSDRQPVRLASVSDHALADHVHQVLSRVQNVVRSWDHLPNLPFVELATWTAPDLAWLYEPMDPDRDEDRRWIAAFPKIELHCHLGGFATDGALLHRVRGAGDQLGLPSLKAIALPDGWPEPTKAIGLEIYRSLGDNNGSALLKDPDRLELQCRMLYEYFLEENIVYAEVRCSPANYADRDAGRSPWDVLAQIQDVFNDCMRSARGERGWHRSCHVNLIIIGTRQQNRDYRSGIARHLALAVTAAEKWTDVDLCRVVGVDLAGFEDPATRAHYFREEFSGIHRCGLAVTVHAGENDEAEGIWRAVLDLNARRLGHALTLVESPELMKVVADRRIGIEMCPYANFQIRGYSTGKDAARESDQVPGYPLHQYLQSGIQVSVNTDNIGISGAGLTANLLFASRLCPGLRRIDMATLQRHALEMIFAESRLRERLRTTIDAGIPAPRL